MATIEEIRDVLAQSFERMLETLEQADETIEIYPSWTVKEIIAHLIGWDKVSSDSLSSFIQGGTPDKVSLNGVDAFNAEAVEALADLSLEETIQEWEKERQVLLDILTAFTDKQLETKITYPWGSKDTVARMLFSLSAHDTLHTNDIIAIIQF
jgi:hypothetical protein